jgi:hypothetical protein
MPLTPQASAYAQYWGVIQASVSEHLPTQEVFRAVQQYAEDMGLDLPKGMFQGINQLRSLAVAQRNAADNWGNLSPGDTFTRAMAPWDINARDLTEANQFPEYLVRFDMTSVDEFGNLTTITRTMRDTWRPDMTVGDVIRSVQESAEGLALDYGITLSGIGNIRPVSI